MVVAPARSIAQGIYMMVLGALAVAEKDITPGAAERRRLIALAADAYFPYTGFEEPAWVRDAPKEAAVSADQSCSD